MEIVISVCDHEARIPIDDADLTFSALNRREKLIAVVAPAIASSFPDTYLKINGWLASMGVSAVFDVSFGAELTVKSYIEHIKENKPKIVIAQPCPAIVSYIELYKPELIPYLAPADSPMLHTIKMIKEFYPEYKNHKVIVLSPCIAKKREFEETGYGDFNLTFSSLEDYFKKNRINLYSYPEKDYDNKPAERAVSFSSPGGLLRTAAREIPDIVFQTRKIEGKSVYEYLDGLPEQIRKGHVPILLDCLNCEKGCNGGTGTNNQHTHIDELEFFIQKRIEKMQEMYEKSQSKTGDLSQNINDYWKKNLYNRSYKNNSVYNKINTPGISEMNNILKDMNKTSKSDEKNCPSCGYNNCKDMAKAIYNKLNKKENCHFYMNDEMERMNKDKIKFIQTTTEELHNSAQGLNEVHEYIDNVNSQNVIVENIFAQMNTISSSVNLIADTAHKEKASVQKLTDITDKGNQTIEKTSDTIYSIHKNMDGILAIIQIINDISSQTNLLALNAKIQAVHAGDFGKGFSVIADEIKTLANSTADNANKIAETLEDVVKQVNGAYEMSNDSKSTFGLINSQVSSTAESLNRIINEMMVLSQTSNESMNRSNEAKVLTEQLHNRSRQIGIKIDELKIGLNSLEENLVKN